MLRGVTELAERGHNVRLGFPVLRFQLLREVLIEFRGTCAVEEDQDFEFLFHDLFRSAATCRRFQCASPVRALQIYFVRLNLPVKR